MNGQEPACGVVSQQQDTQSSLILTEQLFQSGTSTALSSGENDGFRSPDSTVASSCAAAGVIMTSRPGGKAQ